MSNVMEVDGGSRVGGAGQVQDSSLHLKFKIIPRFKPDPSTDAIFPTTPTSTEKDVNDESYYPAYSKNLLFFMSIYFISVFLQLSYSLTCVTTLITKNPPLDSTLHHHVDKDGVLL